MRQLTRSFTELRSQIVVNLLPMPKYGTDTNVQVLESENGLSGYFRRQQLDRLMLANSLNNLGCLSMHLSVNFDHPLLYL